MNMPAKAAKSRGESISELSSIVHTKFLALNEDGLLTKLKKQVDTGALRGSDVALVEETWRDYTRAKKLPDAFIRERALLITQAHTAWEQARHQKRRELFLPYLEKIIALKRKEAKLLGYKDHPYDALLDEFEPGMKTKEAEVILEELKTFLVPFLRKTQKASKKRKSLRVQGHFPIEKQVAFNTMMAKEIGFDFEMGRLDTSVHPFTTTIHAEDVRITTRYKENDALYALSSTIHETGHALYEQGLLAEHFGTPLGDYISLGIHESQSRMWERIIGTSKPFWKYFYPKLQKAFPQPYKKVSFDDFYHHINTVTPSFIRTEADEVTYNLHIILRFELEKELISGKLSVRDLPNAWNKKMKEYFGITVKEDNLGFLQDVHWSIGAFGYFPTYTFGNLYSAQFYNAMKRDIPTLEKDFEKGNFKKALAWLRAKIHNHGKLYKAKDLAHQVTGEALTSVHFTNYLKEKYTNLYNL